MRLHTADGQFVVYSTLKELEAKLPAAFFKIHRSHVVNLDQPDIFNDHVMAFIERVRAGLWTPRVGVG